MNNLTGSLLMIASMAGFALEDMFIKGLTATLPTGQILLGIGLGGALAFALILRARSGSFAALAHPAMAGPAMILRNLGEAGAALAFVTALALVPISTVTAVFQASPLAMTAAAALFLGEAVGWRRWSAVAVGFLGVLIIIRPGGTDFSAATLLPLVAVAGIVLRDLLTRRLPGDVSSLAVSAYGFAALALAGCLLLAAMPGGLKAMSGWEIAAMGGAILFGIGAYYALVAAMRMADTAAIMPFRYTRLVFALIIGLVVFGERPDAATYVGAALVIGSGLFTIWREARLSRSQRPVARATQDTSPQPAQLGQVSANRVSSRRPGR